MSLWNRLRPYADTCHGWTRYAPKPIVFLLPRPQVDEQELRELPEGQNLQSLYRLDLQCTRTICEIAHVIFGKGRDSGKRELLGLLAPLSSLADETVGMPDIKQLASDVIDARTAYQANDGFAPTEGLRRLESVEAAAQDWLCHQPRKGTNKVDALLGSFSEGYADYGEEEALVYLISRGRECRKACQELFARWKVDEAMVRQAKDRSAWRFWPVGVQDPGLLDPCMLRAADWIKVAGFKRYWDQIAQSATFNVPRGQSDFRIPFDFFRSELAIELMKKDLVKWLTRAWVWLDELLTDSYPDEEAEIRSQSNASVAAAFVFGCARLPGSVRDRSAVGRACEFLLGLQRNGPWGIDDRGEFRPSTSLTAMAMHALSLARPDGWENAVALASDWLLTRQLAYGPWTAEGGIGDLHLTVLVLDALALASSETQVTFRIAEPRKVGRRNKPMGEPQPAFAVWRDPGDACFIVKENRILFHYKGRIRDLRLKSGSRAHRLLKALHAFERMSAVEVKEDLCPAKVKPSEAVRDINRGLNHKAAALGFTEVPQDVAYIVYVKADDSYRSTIPIRSQEDFDREDMTGEAT